MTEQTVPAQPSAKRHMMRGTAWMLALRWGVRLTGLISTIFLARLLTPADYGIVAIATLVSGTIDVFAEAGQANAIIRHPNPMREHYDSAWTISVMLAFGLALIILAASPLTVLYFHEPQAKLVLEILALRTLLAGFQNVGIVNFQRDLNFRKQFQLSVGSTLIQFVVVMASAVVLRNYWALVIGIISKQVSTVALSYVLEPYRPRLSFSKVPELFSFSFWTLLRNVGGYANNQIDKVAIGGFGGAVAMGRYEVGRDVAASPITEIVGPMVWVLFPVLATVQFDKEKRRELFLTVLSWSALICTSTAVGVALVANDMSDLILGPQWVAVKALIPWLALSYGVVTLTGCVYNAFDALGQAVVSARLQWMRVLALVLATFPVAYYFRNLEAVAIARFWVAVVISPTLFLALSKALDVPMSDFGRVLWRPFVAGIAMAVIVLAVNATIPFTGIFRLLLDVLFGAISFGSSLTILWRISGRPEGPEKELWTAVAQIAGHLRIRIRGIIFFGVR
jgi:lipopolysaccharide exporter